MAENGALDAANDVINHIIEKIGQCILDKYIGSKYLPHSATNITNACASLTNVSILKKILTS